MLPIISKQQEKDTSLEKAQLCCEERDRRRNACQKKTERKQRKLFLGCQAATESLEKDGGGGVSVSFRLSFPKIKLNSQTKIGEKK
jgi:hypothetical protein